MIDTAIRSQGIGGSEIAAIVGLDPRRDKFAVYAEKLGLVERAEPSARMKWGKRIERVIAEGYAEETKQDVRWCDETMFAPDRRWQVMTPDAFVWGQTAINGIPRINPVGGVDAKNVAWDQAHLWEDGAIPDHIALQLQWYMSAASLPWWDVAALFGGNDLRVHRVHFDPEIEAVLLAEGEDFWTKHVLAKSPPPIGSSATAAEYLRQRFPKNTQALRSATDHEAGIIARLMLAKSDFDRAKRQKTEIENEVKQAIGDAEGLESGLGRVTYKICKDTLGTNWEAVARELNTQRGLLLAVAHGEAGSATVIDEAVPEWLSFDQMAAAHQVVTREGVRKLLTPRSWGKEE